MSRVRIVWWTSRCGAMRLKLKIYLKFMFCISSEAKKFCWVHSLSIFSTHGLSSHVLVLRTFGLNVFILDADVRSVYW